MAPVKIFVATPAHGETFFSPCVQSLYKLAVELERAKWSSSLATVSYADVAQARNVLLTYWFDRTDASHILYVDADMGFEPQLIFDMVDFDKAVVGAIYPKRQIDLDRFATAIAAGQSVADSELGAHDFVVQKPSPGTIRKGFIRVDSCGTGIILLQRSCVERMLHQLPEIVDEGPSRALSPSKDLDRIIRAFDFLTLDGVRLSEDFSFCYRWREKCGGEIWANIAHEITHVGIRHFKARYSAAPRMGVRTIEMPISAFLSRSNTANPKS